MASKLDASRSEATDIVIRQLQLRLDTWCEVKDGDHTARDIFNRHYSRRRYADGRKPRLFVGPGEKMVLVTPSADALFVWRKFISGDGQLGVNCAVFRNESMELSSWLIKEAVALAWDRWPGQRLYTYVNPRKVRSSNPGYCFLQAGWRKCGITKHNKLIILELIPQEAKKPTSVDNKSIRLAVRDAGRGSTSSPPRSTSSTIK